MRKIGIVVPKGTKYVSEIKDFELPNGILNKGIPNCGATTLALTDRHKAIVCSPRNNLLVNKHEQYRNTLLVVGGVTESEIKEYVRCAETPKILVSYDSLPKVAGCIEDKSDWRVVADEFQYLLSDSGFKSEVEHRFMAYLKQFEYVTFLSATPILDKYIGQINDFKNMPYYQMKWQDVEKIKVIRVRTPRPIDAAVEIVRSYQQGAFPRMEIDGTAVYSKECVIFLNSVNNILNIIKQTGLKPDEVNIIVGNSTDNDSQIKKLGADFMNGRIPLKGEKHKMFTFCTSTAFAGCDFYSANATSFVISDSKRVNTAIDIATDLVQIAGRQRLAENPFRKHIVFVYNMSMLDKSEEVFEKELQDKLRLTYAEVESNNLISDKALRQKRIRDVCRLQKMLKYDESFIMYDSLQDKFVTNEMAMLNERYSYDLQRYNYENGIVVKNQLVESGFDVSAPQVYNEPQCYKEYEEQLGHIIRKESFADRMKSYCDYRGGAMFNLSAMLIEQKYPELRLFYDELGGERIKALGYKECELKNEVALRNMRNRLRNEFVRLFSKRTISADKIKAAMNEVYSRYGIKKKGKVSDLSDLYGLKVMRHRPISANGERGYLYEIE